MVSSKTASRAHSNDHGWRPALPVPASPELDRALLAADLPTLLMAYVHVSRDEAMLDRFEQHIHAIGSGKQTDIPEALAVELRAKMKAAITTPGAAADGEPKPELLHRIMCVGMGEAVGAEFIPLLLEQTGLGQQPDRSAHPAAKIGRGRLKVLIIGAGLTGMCAGIKLGEAGYDYTIIEKHPEVGGTWYTNRYPGVAVDTPSYFYSYSFELNAEWSTYMPQGAEMQDYLLRVSHKYPVREHIRFETTVTALHWNEHGDYWTVTLRDKNGVEEAVEANIVINAHGPLDRWEWPKIPGIEEFQGPLMHSAKWDSSIDLKGKRVGLIGTGASGAQIAPAIAPEVDDLTIFMRSRHWFLPSHNGGRIVSEDLRWAAKFIPFYLEYFRFFVYWTGSDGLYTYLLRDPAYEGNPTAISAENEALGEYCLAHMHKKLEGRPDLIEKLTPDSPCFSKRIIQDVGWYDALKRDNVTVEIEPVDRITTNGIQMKDGRFYELDVLVAATGFTIQKMTGSLQIIGRDGRSLGEEWGDEDAEGYFGITVPGYPNYFHMNGPNSGPNHGAGLNLVSEAQVNYILECLDYMIETGAAAIEPTEEAAGEFNDVVQTQMPKMIWSHPRAKNYYKNSKGRVVTSWPFRLLDYWNGSRHPDVNHYNITPLAKWVEGRQVNQA